MSPILLVRIGRGIAIGLLLGTTALGYAQWRMQASGTTAGLRGIHAVDAETAWASGTNGTILHTRDGGQHWQACTVPDGAEKLDFRSVWAWDAEHAMVMSSGTGAESRLYSTHDACRTWRLVFTNPDADGFWDALQFDGKRFGAILGDPVRGGDPVNGSFTLFATYDGGSRWTRQLDPCLRTVDTKQGAFAASNQSMALLSLPNADAETGPNTNHQIWFGTSGGWLYGLQLVPFRLIGTGQAGCTHTQALSGLRGASAGIFAIGFRDHDNGVAVGGDYTKPQNGSDSAATTSDGGKNWLPALHPPAGYRSTVEWNASDESWIAAGPTGSDVSRDGGKTWQPLDRESWNALGLPFVVGPHGRIARLVSWGQLRAANTTRDSAVPAGK